MAASAQDAQQSAPAHTPPQVNTPANAPNAQMNKDQMAQRMAENQAKHLEKDLNLNSEQYKGVYIACLDWAKSIQSMNTPGKPMKPGDHEQLEAEKDAKIKKVLTPEQYTKYEMTRHRGIRPGGPNQPPPVPPAPPAPVKN